MMQSELQIQPSSPIHSYFHSIMDQDGLNYLDFYTSKDRDFPSTITNTPEDSLSSIPSLSYLDMFPGDCDEYSSSSYDQMQDSSLININGFDDVCRWLCDDDQQMEEVLTDRSSEGSHIWSPSLSMNSNDSMEIESEPGIENLFMAYTEAKGLGQGELAKVIQKCISEKASPVGPTLERLAINLFQSAENQGLEYLIQESTRNFKTALRVFYEIFPYGRFAHFTANSAILEAVPTHVYSVHIVDFDMGEGIQWPPVIEAMARTKKSLTITSVKLEEHDSRSKETKRHLFNYARNFGLNLKVEEIELSQLGKVMEGRKFDKEFLAFNCMVGLPHMGKTRKRTQVMRFLKVAEGFLAENDGIITFGDGQEGERIRNSSDYVSFLNTYLAHYKALYESMEWGFPSYLNEARISMETLFLVPFISTLSWFQKWEEGRYDMVLRSSLGLKNKRMSRESWNEAREMVKEGETPYKIRVQGDDENEMVLEWRGTPLVRVYACIN